LSFVSFVATELFHYTAPFLAMAELKRAQLLLVWLNENVQTFCKDNVFFSSSTQSRDFLAFYGQFF